MDPVHKLLWVAQVEPRTCDLVCLMVHALCQWLAPGCVPAFRSDGLMHYLTALTAHWGSWQAHAQGKCVWQVAVNLLYAQVVKQYVGASWPTSCVACCGARKRGDTR